MQIQFETVAISQSYINSQIVALQERYCESKDPCPPPKWDGTTWTTSEGYTYRSVDLGERGEQGWLGKWTYKGPSKGFLTHDGLPFDRVTTIGMKDWGRASESYVIDITGASGTYGIFNGCDAFYQYMKRKDDWCVLFGSLIGVDYTPGQGWSDGWPLDQPKGSEAAKLFVRYCNGIGHGVAFQKLQIRVDTYPDMKMYFRRCKAEGLAI